MKIIMWVIKIEVLTGGESVQKAKNAGLPQKSLATL
jgi:hypothetical protein